jgi:hypothetical protein
MAKTDAPLFGKRPPLPGYAPATPDALAALLADCILDKATVEHAAAHAPNVGTDFAQQSYM